jgi:hypothetical protein
MIREGKITADEGSRLLNALNAGAKRSAQPAREPRWLRVRVTDQTSGKAKVNVNLPMSLVQVAIRMGAKFVPSNAEFDAATVMDAIKSGSMGKIYDAEDGGEHVEVWVE